MHQKLNKKIRGYFTCFFRMYPKITAKATKMIIKVITRDIGEVAESSFKGSCEGSLVMVSEKQ